MWSEYISMPNFAGSRLVSSHLGNGLSDGRGEWGAGQRDGQHENIMSPAPQISDGRGEWGAGRRDGQHENIMSPAPPIGVGIHNEDIPGYNQKIFYIGVKRVSRRKFRRRNLLVCIICIYVSSRVVKNLEPGWDQTLEK